MNVFLLHESPDEAATALVDKHVSKMCLEATQIANTGLHLAGHDEYTFYGKTHTDHPWCEFASQSFDHWLFVVRHAQALGREFLRRYDDRHTSHDKLRKYWSYDDMRAIEKQLDRARWEEVWTDLPQAMPEQYTKDCPVEAYQSYYHNEKLTKDWAFYEKVDPPAWFIEDTPLDRWF